MSQEPSSNSVSHRETREEGPPISGEGGIAQGMESKKKISISEIEGVPVKITMQIGAIQHNLHKLEETQQFLLEQNNTIVAQLSKVESERNEQKAENANLEKASENFGKAIENLNSQMEGLYRLLIQNATEPEYEKLRELQRKRLTFLLEQNNRIVVQLSKGESERNELKKRNANLEKALKNIQCQVEELQRSKTKNATEPEGLETPVAQPPQDEVQGTGMWHRGAKCLLKVGLGLATAALIVPAAFWVFSKMFT